MLEPERINLIKYRLEKAFSDLLFVWEGDFKQHRIHADFMSTSANGELEFVGGCLQDICELKFDKASFSLNQDKIWRLCNPVNLMVTHTELKPFNACWTNNNSNLYMKGLWNEESGWEVGGDVNDDPLKGMIELVIEVFNKDHLGWGKVVRY